MQGNPVVWFEIYVKDMQRESILRICASGAIAEAGKLAADMLNVVFSFPNAGLQGHWCIGENGWRSINGNGTIVYFTCDDCATEASKFQRAVAKSRRTNFDRAIRLHRACHRY